MAQRRMLNKTISISKQVNRLSIEARLLFTWSIPHLDDWGRLDKDSEVIKAIVVPMAKEITEKKIEDEMAEMVEQGLVEEMSDCYYFKGFDNHQSISESKKAKSKFEAEPLESEHLKVYKEFMGGKNTKFPEASKKPEKTKDDPTPAQAVKNDTQAIYEGYEEAFGRTVKVRNTDRSRKIKKRLETFTVDQVKQAFSNCSRDDFMTGNAENNNKFYATLDYFIRNDENIEKWLDQTPHRSAEKEYIINGRKVSKEEFEAMKGRLNENK